MSKFFMDKYQIYDSASFERAPNVQPEFCFLICGSLRGFFPEKVKIVFLSEKSKNNTDGVHT